MNYPVIFAIGIILLGYLNFLDLTKMLLFVLACLVFYLIKMTPKSSIPGPLALPLIGNIPLMMKMDQTRKPEFYKALAKKYGQVFRIYFGQCMIVFVCGFDNLYNMYVKKADVFTDRPDWLPEMANRKGGLSFKNGETWKTIRRFTIKTFRDLGVGKHTIEDMIQDELHYMLEAFDKSKGEPISNARTLATAASGNILHHIIFGFRLNYEDKAFMRMIECIIGIFQSPGVFFFGAVMPMWLQKLIPSVRQRMECQVWLDDYINGRIKENSEIFDSENIHNYVEAYITQEDPKSIFQRDCMADVIVELLVAGTDSSGTTLDWAILYMIAFPEVQQKCFEEIEQVIGSGRRIQASDRSKLTYIEATLLEIQRYASIGSEIVPHMASADSSINGYDIPKGTIVVGLLTSVHHDTHLWKDSHKFNPDRFIDDSGNICNREYVITFGLGPRVCLGEALARMELFLLFTGLIQRFKLTKVSPDAEVSLRGISGISTHAMPYKLRCQPRY